MTGYVYKYTHKENGKWYIGSHNGNNPEYSGSGLLWQRAKEKYGLKSFTKEILYEGDLFRETEEIILKDLDAMNDPMSYNMKNEALGGSFPGKLNGMYGKAFTEEHKYACGSAFRGKKRPDHSERMKGSGNPMFGKTHQAYGIINKSKENKGKTNEEIHGKEKAKEISEKIAKGNKGKLKPGTSAANKGGGNASAKPILFRGIKYDCIKEAMEKTKLSRYKIKKECEYQ